MNQPAEQNPYQPSELSAKDEALAAKSPPGFLSSRGCANVGCAVLSLLIVIALLLPTVRVAREPARRMQCSNNTKQLVLAIQNYHDAFMCVPTGARPLNSAQGEEPGWGPSWVFDILPYAEQKHLWDAMVCVRDAGATNDFFHPDLWQLADNRKIKFLLCPSSPLPEMELRQAADGATFNLVTPSYVGIAGAWGDVPSAIPAEAFSETRGLPVGPNGGMMSGGGMLLVNEALTFADCIDGTAFQIVVGECSDYYLRPRQPAHRIDGAGVQGAWFVGCNFTERAEVIDPGNPPAEVRGPVYNLMTVRHGLPNGNRSPMPPMGSGGTGIDRDKGANNPLVSAHPNGSMVGFLDGHVELFTNQLSELILKQLATRDDGVVTAD